MFKAKVPFWKTIAGRVERLENSDTWQDSRLVALDTALRDLQLVVRLLVQDSQNPQVKTVMVNRLFKPDLTEDDD